jgi:hypothetical protein
VPWTRHLCVGRPALRSIEPAAVSLQWCTDGVWLKSQSCEQPSYRPATTRCQTSATTSVCEWNGEGALSEDASGAYLAVDGPAQARRRNPCRGGIGAVLQMSINYDVSVCLSALNLPRVSC